MERIKRRVETLEARGKTLNESQSRERERERKKKGASVRENTEAQGGE